MYFFDRVLFFANHRYAAQSFRMPGSFYQNIRATPLQKRNSDLPLHEEPRSGDDLVANTPIPYKKYIFVEQINSQFSPNENLFL